MQRYTKEKQYQSTVQLSDTLGQEKLGLMTNKVWYDDPIRLGFVLARYKFVAKMLDGYNKVIEIGCADAFGSRIVSQFVNNLTLLDFDEVFINDVKKRENNKWKCNCILHDILKSPIPSKEKFDAAYSIDVLEHISLKDEDLYISNIVKSLNKNGVLIVGTPSIYSQSYASPASKKGHVNCKNNHELKSLLKKYFHNVFMFSMNDEVLHTGFAQMSHYYFALASSQKV